jgi:hypothetical protein
MTHFQTSTRTITTSYKPMTTTKVYYETTVTKTVILNTIYVEDGSTPVSIEPLSFVVADGSTQWLGGVPPASTGSYVVITTSFTVIPVITADPILVNNDHTRTTTVHNTIFNSHQYTITMTLLQQKSVTTAIPASISVITGKPFTGIAPGGWNTSSGFDYGISVSKPAHPFSDHFFVSNEHNYDLYRTRPLEFLTATKAKSGFTVLDQLLVSSTLRTDSVWTTAIIDGKVMSPTTTAKTSLASSTSHPNHSPYTHSTPILIPGSFNTTVGGVVSSTISNIVYSYLIPGSLTSTGTQLPSSIDKMAGNRPLASPNSFLTIYLSTSSTLNSSAAGASPTGGDKSAVNPISTTSHSGINNPTSPSSPTSTILHDEGLPNSVPSLNRTVLGSMMPSVVSFSTIYVPLLPVSSSVTSIKNSVSMSSETASSTKTRESSDYTANTFTMSFGQTSSYTSSSASTAPSQCGEIGDFILNVRQLFSHFLYPLTVLSSTIFPR